MNRSWDALSDAEKNAARAAEAHPSAKAMMATLGSQIVNADPAPPPLGDLAARALAAGAAMAREYAAAAGELCRHADTVPTARASARRLLRLALAHLEN